MTTAILQQLIAGTTLSEDAMRHALQHVMSGDAEPAWTGAFLAALQQKGVTPSELAAAAVVMREHATPIDTGDVAGVVDTCGTGGTGSGTFNISTAAAIVAAACGVGVVKHGNRAASSKTGSADVLEALGVDLSGDPKTQFERAGIAFAFARNHHPAMKHVAPVRQALGVPTIFNLLGPLTNPAGVRRQLLGVSRPELLDLVAGALLKLGSERAWVVHSDDGQDDLSPGVPTQVAEVVDGEVRRWTFDPTPHDLAGTKAELQAESPEASATLIRRILDGDETGPPHNAVLINAAAAVVIAGGHDDIVDALDAARHAIESGRAAETLDRLVG
ncbi:MAG: anthranilate phosphoribosyltransferase [Planctomycetota bacterium]